MLLLALAAATGATEDHRDLPMPPWVFAAVALGLFFTLFLITWSFRSVANKMGATTGASGGH